MAELSPQQRAEKSAAAMWASDAASKHIGIEVVAVAPGEATCTLEVRAHNCNGHGNCHGGYIFTLADTAFAFACNTYNQTTVAQHNTISYVTPGRQGDVLTARAVEVSRTGRSGIYDVTVTNQENVTIAVFRGCSRTIKGQLFEETSK